MWRFMITGRRYELGQTIRWKQPKGRMVFSGTVSRIIHWGDIHMWDEVYPWVVSNDIYYLVLFGTGSLGTPPTYVKVPHRFTIGE